MQLATLTEKEKQDIVNWVQEEVIPEHEDATYDKVNIQFVDKKTYMLIRATYDNHTLVLVGKKR